MATYFLYFHTSLYSYFRTLLYPLSYFHFIPLHYNATLSRLQFPLPDISVRDLSLLLPPQPGPATMCVPCVGTISFVIYTLTPLHSWQLQTAYSSIFCTTVELCTLLHTRLRCSRYIFNFTVTVHGRNLLNSQFFFFKISWSIFSLISNLFGRFSDFIYFFLNSKSIYF